MKNMINDASVNEWFTQQMASLTPMKMVLALLMGFIVDSPALGVGYAVAMMFVYYVYVFWFCNFGSKIGLSK